ncbi:winged helix-turn-helix domain-containing protein [Streptomyces sp. RKAG337]|uniref:winged helix-turn-helix domain-containing protein n=1 Tax=Streptomyces sp. RKAG337 TaxID=2893404 RepID=UPI00203498BC|nr:helix-turn-helix domain-containing protein [Streptomyces sp. RKAG337]MCM2428455.1 helix-turn-helix domain-containing protein [Streptomyces sp. RKAG337]
MTERQIQLTDPRALRAYAHPTRMMLTGLLRREGPFTATRAAELTGESVASCSYHLRVLAKFGLVEEAEGGHGRQKPWRATARFTDWPGYSDDPAVAEAADALTVAVAENYFQKMTKALETRRELSRAWQEAEQFGDRWLHLTPEELVALGAKVDELLETFADRDTDPALRPDGAERVSFLRIAFLDRDTAAPAGHPAADDPAPGNDPAHQPAPDPAEE